jgi:hypothetical protein
LAFGGVGGDALALGVQQPALGAPEVAGVDQGGGVWGQAQCAGLCIGLCSGCFCLWRLSGVRGGQAQQQGDEVLCAGSSAVQVVQLTQYAQLSQLAELSQWGRAGLGLIDPLCVGAWCGAGAPVQGACQGGVAAALPVGGDAVARLQVAHAGQVAAQVGGDGVLGGQGAQPGATRLMCMRLAHYSKIGLDALAGLGVDIPARFEQKTVAQPYAASCKFWGHHTIDASFVGCFDQGAVGRFQPF